MHEFSVASSLLSLVEAQARRHGATRVVKVHVRVGELAGVESELLRQAYELVRERSICADAPLEIEHVPLRWACGKCDRTLEGGALLRCPECDAPAELAAGSELLLDRVEMEVP